MTGNELQSIIAYLKREKESGKPRSIGQLREELEKKARLLPCPENALSDPTDIEGIYAEWISMPASRKDTMILYLHGGYYSAGSCDTHRALAARIAEAARANVLLPEYRLAPEHPFPAALEDSLAVYNQLLSYTGKSATKIILAGDSAGGGLALATVLLLHNTGAVLPDAVVSISPWTDLTNTGDSFKTKADVDPMLSPGQAEYCAGLYLGAETPENPLASPLYGDLEGLPPLLIQVGSEEILLDDSIRFARKAKECGVTVQLDIWNNMFHVFQAFAGMLPEGQRAIKKIGEFIETV